MEDMITSGNRFIERMYFKVREGVENGDVEARYINTKLNVADVQRDKKRRTTTVAEIVSAIQVGEAKALISFAATSE